MISKWRKMSSKRQRSIVLGSLIGIMILMAIGYAAFSSQLQINGTSNISSNWDIRITNITSSLSGGASNATEPTYDNENGLTASFSTNLTSPGDYAEYTVEVSNLGDIDATLTGIEISDSNNPAIVFETSGIEEGDNLLQGAKDELLVKVSYSDSVTSDPENKTSNITVTLTYEQATGGSVPEEPNTIAIGGQEIPVVTENDGLYKDSYESNVYTYRGKNPNNYVTFNGESWRIISANTSDNTIKIIRSSVLSDREYDNYNGRYSSSGYCNDNFSGCNIWGSSSTLYNASLSPITTLAREVGGTAYALPTSEAELNTYLNTTYYNGLNATARSMIKSDAVYKAGVLKLQSSQTTSTDISQVSATKWKGKVGLIDATEYVRASTNSSCTGAYAYYYNSSCYNNSSNHNWMYLNDIWWTMSPVSRSHSYYVWYVDSSGHFYNCSVTSTLGVRPVLTLASNVQITGGVGTSSSPYTLGLNSGQF